MLALRGFRGDLAAVACLALGVRVLAAYDVRTYAVRGDAEVFHGVARRLADGDGFQLFWRDSPTAEHPPVWELVLAGANLLGADGHTSHRLLGALIGTVTVVLIGLLGEAVADRRVGLVAAGLAAVYPMLWAADVSLMSETLYGAFLVAALLAAVHRRPALLGLLLGLAALTRGEALLLLPLLAVPLFWGRWRELALVVGVFALVLAPWTIRNLATFDEPVLISTNANGIWAGANCQDSYHGSLAGAWAFDCYRPERAGEDESEWAARQRDAGFDYMRDHASELPRVMLIRLARTLEVWWPGQAQALGLLDGRNPHATKVGQWMWWLLAPLAIAGAVMLRRDRWVLLAPVLLVLLVTLATYGSTRFRFAAEPSVCVLAAVTLVGMAKRLGPAK